MKYDKSLLSSTHHRVPWMDFKWAKMPFSSTLRDDGEDPGPLES